jgi:hypothetical protein
MCIILNVTSGGHMDNVECKRFAYVKCLLDVPVEWEGNLEGWHDAFIKLMKEKGLQEHSASALDNLSAMIICDGCDKEFHPSKMNPVNNSDEVLCDSCMSDLPEPDKAPEWDQVMGDR